MRSSHTLFLACHIFVMRFCFRLVKPIFRLSLSSQLPFRSHVVWFKMLRVPWVLEYDGDFPSLFSLFLSLSSTTPALSSFSSWNRRKCCCCCHSPTYTGHKGQPWREWKITDASDQEVTSYSVEAPIGEASRVTTGGRRELCNIYTASIASGPQQPIKMIAFEPEGWVVPDKLF